MASVESQVKPPSAPENNSSNNYKSIQQILKDHKLCSIKSVQPDTLKSLPIEVHENLFVLLNSQQQAKLVSVSSKKINGKRPNFNKKYCITASRYLRDILKLNLDQEDSNEHQLKLENNQQGAETPKSKSSRACSSKNSSLKIDSGHGNSNSKSSSLNSFSSDGFGQNSFSTDPINDGNSLNASPNKIIPVKNESKSVITPQNNNKSLEDLQNIGETFISEIVDFPDLAGDLGDLGIQNLETNLVPLSTTLDFAEITDEDTNNLATFDDIGTLPEDFVSDSIDRSGLEGQGKEDNKQKEATANNNAHDEFGDIHPTFGIKKPDVPVSTSFPLGKSPSSDSKTFQLPAEPFLPLQISKATDFYSNSGENSNQGLMNGSDDLRSRHQSSNSISVENGQIINNDQIISNSNQANRNQTAQSSSGVSTASRISAVSNSTSITNLSLPSLANNPMQRIRRSSRTSSILAFPVVPQSNLLRPPNMDVTGPSRMTKKVQINQQTNLVAEIDQMNQNSTSVSREGGNISNLKFEQNLNNIPIKNDEPNRHREDSEAQNVVKNAENHKKPEVSILKSRESPELVDVLSKSGMADSERSGSGKISNNNSKIRRPFSGNQRSRTLAAKRQKILTSSSSTTMTQENNNNTVTKCLAMSSSSPIKARDPFFEDGPKNFFKQSLTTNGNYQDLDQLSSDQIGNLFQVKNKNIPKLKNEISKKSNSIDLFRSYHEQIKQITVIDEPINDTSSCSFVNSILSSKTSSSTSCLITASKSQNNNTNNKSSSNKKIPAHIKNNQSLGVSTNRNQQGDSSGLNLVNSSLSQCSSVQNHQSCFITPYQNNNNSKRGPQTTSLNLCKSISVNNNNHENQSIQNNNNNNIHVHKQQFYPNNKGNQRIKNNLNDRGKKSTRIVGPSKLIEENENENKGI